MLFSQYLFSCNIINDDDSQGTYVRVALSSVPAEFVENFDARRPLLIGGLATSEESYGFVQVRLKRHR